MRAHSMGACHAIKTPCVQLCDGALVLAAAALLEAAPLRVVGQCNAVLAKFGPIQLVEKTRFLHFFSEDRFRPGRILHRATSSLRFPFGARVANNKKV